MKGFNRILIGKKADYHWAPKTAVLWLTDSNLGFQYTRISESNLVSLNIKKIFFL